MRADMEQETGPAIITPTYRAHFKYIRRYLRSFDRYVQDKEDVTVYFIIGENERAAFQEIITPYASRCDIRVLCFEDILRSCGVDRDPAELLRTYGKYSFQTLKKFYGMLYINRPRYLVLDSEACWVRPVKMAELFRDFFAAPFIPFSPRAVNIGVQSLREKVTDEAGHVLGVHTDKWYIECFCWYYELAILRELFHAFGSPLEIVQKGKAYEEDRDIQAGVFEIVLYCLYIEANNDLYGYRFIDVYDAYRRGLSREQFAAYEAARAARGDESGFAEWFTLYLTDANVPALAKLYAQNGWNIIHCQTEGPRSYRLQKQFIQEAGTVILATSQAHAFTGGPVRRLYYAAVKHAVIKLWALAKSTVRRFLPGLYDPMKTIRDRVFRR